MTIAIGILAKECVVLAADSQITHEGSFKFDRSKLVLAQDSDHPESGVMAIAGAGLLSYCDSIRAEVLSVFMADRNRGNRATEQAIKDHLKSFYADHVLPFSSWDPRERPDFQILVAAFRGMEFDLWASDRNTLHPCCEFEAIGSGAAYANILLREFDGYSEMGETEARLVAGYVIHKVKNHVDGCGLSTHIVSLSKAGISGSNSEEAEAMEQLFEGCRWSEQAIRDIALGRKHANWGLLKTNATKLGKLADCFGQSSKAATS